MYHPLPPEQRGLGRAWAQRELVIQLAYQTPIPLSPGTGRHVPRPSTPAVPHPHPPRPWLQLARRRGCRFAECHPTSDAQPSRAVSERQPVRTRQIVCSRTTRIGACACVQVRRAGGLTGCAHCMGPGRIGNVGAAAIASELPACFVLRTLDLGDHPPTWLVYGLPVVVACVYYVVFTLGIATHVGRLQLHRGSGAASDCRSTGADNPGGLFVWWRRWRRARPGLYCSRLCLPYVRGAILARALLLLLLLWSAVLLCCCGQYYP